MSAYHRANAGAIAMGTLCACLAGAVLAESAWRTGPTIDHALSIGALLITIAAGHMAVTALRQWHVLRAAGLALVFLVGVTYTVVGTAGRTAEQQQAAIAVVDGRAADRGRLEGERARIVKLRGEAEAMLEKVRGEHLDECKGGAGKRCAGLAQSINVYEAAVTGRSAELAAIDRRLSGLGAAAPANGKLVAFADLLGAVAGMERDDTVRRLTVAWPYVLPLLLELGSIIFWSIGLAGSSLAPSVAHVATGAPIQTEPAPSVPPKGPRRRKLAEVQAERNAKLASFTEAYVARHGRPPSAGELGHGCGVPKTSAWRWQQSTAA